MIKPDQGRIFLKQAKYVARILLSFEPVVTDFSFVVLRKLLQGKFGDVKKKGWYKQVTPLGTAGYIYYGGGEGGEFSPILPEGETVEGVLSTVEEKRVVTNLFLTAVDYLTNNKIFSMSFSSCLLLDIKKPAEINWSSNSEDEKKAIDLLKGTFGVVSYLGYNSLLLKSFRLACVREPYIFFRMQEFIKRLAKDRQEYAIDGKFLGEILAADMLCILCAEAACSTAKEHEKKNLKLIYYNRLIAPILDIGVRYEHFFWLVVKNVLEAGGIDIIWSLAESYREFVYNAKERALNSKTIDEFSEILYSAIPSGWVAFKIYDILSKNTKYLNTTQKKLVNKLRKNSDEILVRIRQPLINQLFDFDLAFWNYTRAHIEKVERNRGFPEAERAAKKIVEARINYPRSFLSKLLGQEPGDPEIIK
ncbi:MAG: hypothetical protein ACFFAJ_17825 [Candidatus Hodarchaeota archaeon]